MVTLPSSYKDSVNFHEEKLLRHFCPIIFFLFFIYKLKKHIRRQYRWECECSKSLKYFNKFPRKKTQKISPYKFLSHRFDYLLCVYKLKKHIRTQFAWKCGSSKLIKYFNKITSKNSLNIFVLRICFLFVHTSWKNISKHNTAEKVDVQNY